MACVQSFISVTSLGTLVCQRLLAVLSQIFFFPELCFEVQLKKDAQIEATINTALPCQIPLRERCNSSYSFIAFRALHFIRTSESQNTYQSAQHQSSGQAEWAQRSERNSCLLFWTHSNVVYESCSGWIYARHLHQSLSIPITNKGNTTVKHTFSITWHMSGQTWEAAE